MTKILILYYSRHGSVLKLANEIANGVEKISDAEAIMRTVPAVSVVNEASEPAIPREGDIYATPEDLEACDGLILGSPCRYGTMASSLKHFFDQTTPQWLSGALSNKPGAVFTSSGSLHGGQESTLLGMMLPLIHHGMLLVGLPFHGTRVGQTESGGSPYGATHVAGSDSSNVLSEDESRLAFQLGQRVAETAVKLKQH